MPPYFPFWQARTHFIGHRLCKKTVSHVNWTGRMPWIIIDGGSSGKCREAVGVIVPPLPSCHMCVNRPRSRLHRPLSLATAVSVDCQILGTIENLSLRERMGWVSSTQIGPQSRMKLETWVYDVRHNNQYNFRLLQSTKLAPIMHQKCTNFHSKF